MLHFMEIFIDIMEYIVLASERYASKVNNSRRKLSNQKIAAQS